MTSTTSSPRRALAAATVLAGGAALLAVVPPSAQGALDVVTVPAVAPAAGTASTASGPRVVDAGGARAVVTRAPFGLRIEDARGRTVLAEVAHPTLDTQVEPPTTDPLPPGTDNQSTTTLYSPLSFLVGTEQLQQQPADEWEGNLLSGTRSGVQYAARDVESVDRIAHGRGLRLTLSTSDPTGRTLVVTVRPRGDHAVAVGVRPVPAAGVAMLGDSFASTAREGFFGFGGRHDRLDQHGRVLSSFVEEENLAAATGPASLPGQFSMFPNGPAAAYYPQAQFVSSRGYGFLLDQPQLSRFKLDVDRDDAWNVSASAHRLSYVVAPGGPARATRTLTAMTGRQPVAPRWALGPMLDRLVKNQGETVADYEGNLVADLRNLRRYRMPITAYRIEGWGFPGGNHGLTLHTWVRPGPQAAMIRALRARHIHPLAYLRPWLDLDSTAVARGYAVRDAQGDPATVVVSGEKRVDLVDFTNPAAVRWWQRQVTAVLRLGFDGFMQDYGEHVLFDMRFHDGSTGLTQHDAYLTEYARATRQAITRFERHHPHRHPWFFTRAGYSGTPGNAAYEGGNFPGDETTDWGHLSGLQSLTTDMLNRAVGGAYGFGTDIGGYLDYTTPATTKELFLRWAEWAAFSPIFRLHGTGLAGTHTPWSYDAQTVRIYRALSKLHLRARPLIQRLWRQADRTGAPVTRPLWWADPSDRSGWTQDQEWLLGPDLLVAPVVEQGATSRSVYLPRGCWTLRSGGVGHQRRATTHRFQGRRSVTVPAAIGVLPYLTRCGTHPLGRR